LFGVFTKGQVVENRSEFLLGGEDATPR